MISNLLQFQLDLKNFATVVTPQNHAELCKRIAIRLHQSIVAGCPDNPNGSPVDTGWFRANWGVYIGRDCPTNPVGTYPAEKRGTGQAMPADTYFKNITSITVASRPFIWVYNNVPYAEALENGHSGKAPNGVVEQALNNVQTFVDTL